MVRWWVLTDCVCRYLIHAPYFEPDYVADDVKLQAAWAAMEDVLASGKTRSIGVSNYDPVHLEATLKTAKVPPTINQIEFHPYMARRDGADWLDALREKDGIAVSAYGALAPLTRNIPGPLDEMIVDIAERYGVSTGLVCLRWCVQQGVVAVTTSGKRERMEEYLRVFDFQLTGEEIRLIGEAGMQCLKEGQVLETRAIKYLRSKLEKERSGEQ